MARPVLLIVSPMPLFPVNAGNRRRLLSMCEFLKASGFDLDFAYIDHEDQIYRRYNRLPPTDMAAMRAYFRKTWLVEIEKPVPVFAKGHSFGADDWCPDEATTFTTWYFTKFPETSGIVVNYVFLSKCLDAAPENTLRIIDTHDRFSDRRSQYRAMNIRTSFFHTSQSEEARGLARADIVIAIQEQEKEFFETLVNKDIFVLYPEIGSVRDFMEIPKIQRVGFVGHGNDANIVSITRFIEAWERSSSLNGIELHIAGDVAGGISKKKHKNINIIGYVESLSDFYASMDIIVAPMVMGTGLKLKVVDALAHGKPVIGTELAFAGIPERPAVLTFKTIDEITGALSEIKNDRNALDRLVSAARSAFSEYQHNVSDKNKVLRRALAIHDRDHKSPAPIRHDDQTNPSKSLRYALKGLDVEECSSDETPDSAPRSSGELIATEIIYQGGEVTAETAYSPARRAWYAKPVQPKQSPATFTAPWAGMRFHLGPIFLQAMQSEAQKQLLLSIAPLIAQGMPDWSSNAHFVGRSSQKCTVSFTGPPALFSHQKILKGFLMTDSREQAFLLDTLSISSSHAGGDEVAEVSARCGSRSGVPLSLHVSLPPDVADHARSILLFGSDVWGILRIITPELAVLSRIGNEP